MGVTSTFVRVPGAARRPEPSALLLPVQQTNDRSYARHFSHALASVYWCSANNLYPGGDDLPAALFQVIACAKGERVFRCLFHFFQFARSSRMRLLFGMTGHCFKLL